MKAVREKADDFGSEEGSWLCAGCRHGFMFKSMHQPFHPSMAAEFGEDWKGKQD